MALDLNIWVVVKAFGSALAVCLVGGAWAFRRSQQGERPSLRPLLATLVLLVCGLICVVQPQTGLAGGFFAIAVLSLAAGRTIGPLLDSFKALVNKNWWRLLNTRWRQRGALAS